MTTKRIVVAMTVPAAMDTSDLAMQLDMVYGHADATVWEWKDFWADHKDGVVTPDGDKTQRLT